MLGLLSVVTDNCMVHIFKVSRSLEIQILLVFKSRKALFNSINPFSNNQQKLLVEPPQLRIYLGGHYFTLHLSSVRPPKKAVDKWNLTAAHHSSWSLDLGSLSAWQSISIPESLRLLSIRLISVRVSFVLMSLERSLQLALVRSQSHNLQGRTKCYFLPRMTQIRKQSPVLVIWMSGYIVSFSCILSNIIPHSFLLSLLSTCCTKSSACNTQKKKQKYAILVDS